MKSEMKPTTSSSTVTSASSVDGLNGKVFSILEVLMGKMESSSLDWFGGITCDDDEWIQQLNIKFGQQKCESWNTDGEAFEAYCDIARACQRKTFSTNGEDGAH